MPKTHKGVCVSIPLSLWRFCTRHCRKHSKRFSTLVSQALTDYLSDVEMNSEESTILRLFDRLQQLDEKIGTARKLRNATIRDGSGLREARDLRVSGTVKRGFKPIQQGYAWTKGQIIDEEERKIYDELSGIVEDLNKERKKILQDPAFKKWLREDINEKEPSKHP